MPRRRQRSRSRQGSHDHQVDQIDQIDQIDQDQQHEVNQPNGGDGRQHDRPDARPGYAWRALPRAMWILRHGPPSRPCIPYKL